MHTLLMQGLKLTVAQSPEATTFASGFLLTSLCGYFNIPWVESSTDLK